MYCRLILSSLYITLSIISLVLNDLRVETHCTIVHTKPISADFYVHTLRLVVVHNIVPYIDSVHICTVPIGGNCTLQQYWLLYCEYSNSILQADRLVCNLAGLIVHCTLYVVHRTVEVDRINTYRPWHYYLLLEKYTSIADCIAIPTDLNPISPRILYHSTI